MNKIKIKGRILEVEECRTAFQKARGLMFRKKSKPLLFVFKKPTRQSIHSFFCRPFKAIWLINGKVIDEKTIEPFSISVKPKEKFTQLVEVLLNGNNNHLFPSEK